MIFPASYKFDVTQTLYLNRNALRFRSYVVMINFTGIYLIEISIHKFPSLAFCAKLPKLVVPTAVHCANLRIQQQTMVSSCCTHAHMFAIHRHLCGFFYKLTILFMFIYPKLPVLVVPPPENSSKISCY